MDIFQNKTVAELAWCSGSAPLMADQSMKVNYTVLDREWHSNQYEIHRDWLLDLDQNPQILEQAVLNQGNLLLGKRFEYLLHFWFSNSPYWEVLLSGYPISSEKRTIGEFDFILKCLETDEILHLEAACKFYLGEHNSGDWKNWIGPNGTDSLHEKMTKLDRQLALREKDAAKEVLSSMNIPTPTPKLFIKGYFFHHFASIAKSKPPKFAHPHYPSGWYIKMTEAEQFFKNKNNWILLPKHAWLSPYNFEVTEQKLMSADQVYYAVNELVRRSGRGMMAVQLDIQEGVTREMSRGFVVADNWPLKSNIK